VTLFANAAASSLLSALSAIARCATAEAVMTEQATMEAAPAPPVLEPVAGAAGEPRGRADEALIADELLVEEVSIDGMCGVY
jgi:mycofactocin precursor